MKILLGIIGLALVAGVLFVVTNRPSHRVVVPAEVEQTPVVDNTLRIKGLQGSF